MSKRATLSFKQSVIFIIFLFLPRILRFFYPKMNLEDSPYLDAISCMTRGLKPHTDFVYTHIPFPEILISLACKLLGTTSYRVTELFCALAVTVTALLIFAIAERIKSKRAGFISAILYAWHPMFFNYHLFEKEIYEALIACVLGIVFINGSPFSKRSVPTIPSQKTSLERFTLITIGTLFFLGYITKLDFSFLVVAILFYLALIEKKFVIALTIFLAFILLVGIHTALSFHFFGEEFLKQVYLFHFLKGTESSQGAKLLKWAGGIGYLILPAIFSFIFLKNNSSGHRWYLILWTLAPFLFFSLVTDTLWFHNVINLIPPLSTLSGVYVDGAVEALGNTKRSLSVGERERNKRNAYILSFSVILCLIATLLFMVWFSKINFGFQGVSRGEISEVAEIVKNNTSEEDIIIAPAIISAQANRTELIHNREVAPVYRWAMSKVAEVGFVRARKEISQIHFRALHEKTARIWLDEINKKISTTSVPVVVGELVPGYHSFNPKPEDMKRYGYRMVYRGKNYVVWVH